MRQENLVTADLSKFGYRELTLASELLTAYIRQGAENLNDGVTLNFNTNSGYVFLSDEDFTVYMMNGKDLDQWFSCPQCGNEGFDYEEYKFSLFGGYCSKQCQEDNE